MKFGDIVSAAALSVVIGAILEVLLGLVLIPAVGLDWGQIVTAAVSILISALIVGYIYAKRIWEEARMETMGKMLVLAAVLVMILTGLAIQSVTDWTSAVHEVYNNANPGTTVSTSQWVTVGVVALLQEVTLNAVMVLALGFIGLYVGSMLRRPAKS